jgi:hypothetical protein
MWFRYFEDSSDAGFTTPHPGLLRTCDHRDMCLRRPPQGEEVFGSPQPSGAWRYPNCKPACLEARRGPIRRPGGISIVLGTYVIVPTRVGVGRGGAVCIVSNAPDDKACCGVDELQELRSRSRRRCESFCMSSMVACRVSSSQRSHHRIMFACGKTKREGFSDRSICL